MDDSDITRLVVGPPSVAILGSSVSQSLGDTSMSNTLRWKGGQWHTGSAGIIERWRRKLKAKSNVLQLSAAKSGVAASAGHLPATSAAWKRVGGGLVVALSGGIGLGMFVGEGMETPDEVIEIRQSQANDEVPVLQALQTVDTPFTGVTDTEKVAPSAIAVAERLDAAPVQVRESPAQEAAALREVPPEASTPLPQDPPAEKAHTDHRKDSGKKAKKQTDKGSVKKSASKSVKEPERSPTKDDEEHASAMILDAVPAGRKSAPEHERVATPKAAPVEPPTPVQKAVISRNRSGLVAVTPDGKAALFTNPRTRLPEQFKVGDKLLNGEIVESIDGKTGRVVTDKREYVLE